VIRFVVICRRDVIIPEDETNPGSGANGGAYSLFPTGSRVIGTTWDEVRTFKYPAAELIDHDSFITVSKWVKIVEPFGPPEYVVFWYDEA
jgi:hypothetical protein